MAMRPAQLSVAVLMLLQWAAAAGLYAPSSFENDECLDNFQVSPNIIIRTQDSRTMGARYLNETEFSSKRDCIQWCCRMTDCNVAVYEEKNKGSCYVFDCGSPSEFKCKFTSHNYYTSAILKVNRHSYDLGKWGFEAKHEEELSQLREKGLSHSTVLVPVISSTPVTTTSTSVVFSTTVQTVRSTAALPKVETKNNEFQEPGRRCSRFQFECRNTSECIAIYNACDGIPQCADGSDESAELGCPTGNNRNVENVNTRNGDMHKSSNNERKWQPTTDKNENAAQNGIEINRKNWEKSGPQTVFKPSVQEPVYPQRHMENILPQNQQSYVNGHHMQQNHAVDHQQSYQQKSNSDDENGASVFNHKSAGLIPVKDGYEYPESSNYYHSQSVPQAYPDQYEGNNRDEFQDSNFDQMQQYPRPQPHISSNYHPLDYDASDYWHTEKSKQAGNRNTYQKPLMSGGPHDEMFEENHEQTHPHGQSVNHALIQSEHENFKNENSHPSRKKYPSQNTPKKMNPKTQYVPYFESSPDPKSGSDFHTLRTEVALSMPSEVTSAASVQHISSAIHSHPQMNKLELNLAEVEVQKVEQRNESNGAVVALTLGLSITGILLVLVGCRVRMVRRHLRRGRSPYAHDADYLVNGMYL